MRLTIPGVDGESITRSCRDASPPLSVRNSACLAGAACYDSWGASATCTVLIVISDTGTSFRFSSFEGAIRALVIGASGGIGFELTRQLAESPEVECVVAAARDVHGSEPLGALLDSSANRLHALCMDVADEVSIQAAVQEIGQSGPHLDLVVNCAGLLHDRSGLLPEKALAQVDPANLERLFRVHAIGPVLLAKHLQPLLPPHERVVFASLSARVGSIGDNRLGGWYAYRLSKAAHNMAIKNLSIELARRARGIICVALHPGTVDTDLSGPFQARVPKEKLFSPARAARQLLQVIDSRTTKHNGGFFAWDGSEIPW
jgi:NAD(P)-dependent dehydrogenase (short-subunit alcohol dehydrogenase family)